jgi:hypothetical protein
VAGILCQGGKGTDCPTAPSHLTIHTMTSLPLTALHTSPFTPPHSHLPIHRYAMARERTKSARQSITARKRTLSLAKRHNIVEPEFALSLLTAAPPGAPVRRPHALFESLTRHTSPITPHPSHPSHLTLHTLHTRSLHKRSLHTSPLTPLPPDTPCSPIDFTGSSHPCAL